MGVLDSPEHLAATQLFIDQRPAMVSFVRSTKTSDGQGGWTKTTPTTLPPQQVRKVAQGRISDTTQRVGADGAVVIPTHVLIGLPSVDVERYDTFTLDGIEHEVLWVNRLPEWRVSAEVVERV